MELLVVCGWYRTICTLCNAMALPVDGWMFHRTTGYGEVAPPLRAWSEL